MTVHTSKRRISRSLRHKRVRRRVAGTPARPRLAVYRSLRHIYAQLIDDTAKRTLASASTIDTELRAQMNGLKKKEQARLVGKTIALRALRVNVKQIAFDRGGFGYHGRIKELADGAREGGLEF